MKIVDVRLRRFRYRTDTLKDSDGHSHPGPSRETTGTLFSVQAEDGTEGT